VDIMFSFVGETLRRLRKERGKTLEQLGEEAGLGRGQLSRIENSRQEATLTTLAKILGSQNVSRREFFRRYDLVEGEAAAIERAAAGSGEPERNAPAGNPGDWPEEIREVLGKLESFVNMTFHQPRPVAQGAIEMGDLVILFRVVPKNAPEAQPPEPPAAGDTPGDGKDEPPPRPKRGGRGGRGKPR
jgi:transcriptional regulator with XRE-family HTH domain